MDRFSTVTGFLAAPTRAAIADDARFQALNTDLTGAEAVLARFTGPERGPLYRAMRWSAPEPFDDGVRITGRLPDDAPQAGVVLVFRLAGDRIALIQEQALPGKPAPASPMRLPDDVAARIDRALAERHPMVVAHVDETGQPVLSFRGSTQAFGPDSLAMWVRNGDGRFLAAIARNPKVALMYRDEDSKATYSFHGRARVTTDPDERARVYARMAPAEQAHDFARTGSAVIVELDLVEGWAGMGPGGQVGRIRLARDA